MIWIQVVNFGWNRGVNLNVTIGMYYGLMGYEVNRLKLGFVQTFGIPTKWLL